MPNMRLTPSYLFESSWEVCNKVGGIHTVLSTKAATLQRMFPDRVLFIGPDLTGRSPQPAFIESDSLLSNWKQQAISEGLSIRIGRWDVPGFPLAILVRFDALYARKERIFTDNWIRFGVDSLHAFGDYDESCLFAWACGEVIHSFIRYKGLNKAGAVAHFDEWTTGMGLLYCKHFLPQVGTVFTTHATSIGRSISGNNLPLYDNLTNYNGDQMARQLNMVSKHSLEKIAAAESDCFTTVSHITARECAALLERTPDVVTPNGFEPLFVKQGEEASAARQEARERLFEVAEALFGCDLPEDTLFVGTSGRYEFRNKGLDVFIDSLAKLREHSSLQRDVVGVVMVPADVSAPRQEVLDRLDVNSAEASGHKGPIYRPFLTHWLNNIDTDLLVNLILHRGFTNSTGEKVKLMVVPCYLDGNDGVFNLPYYDLLPGFDLTVFPSYYEPWGYTPLESIAFSIPTITTNLAGFGAWALLQGSAADISDGVAVLPRSDHNYSQVVNEIALQIVHVSQKSKAEWQVMAERSGTLSESAHWSAFINYYIKAYEMAVSEAESRLQARSLNSHD